MSIGNHQICKIILILYIFGEKKNTFEKESTCNHFIYKYLVAYLFIVMIKKYASFSSLFLKTSFVVWKKFLCV
jgi:hypothetical protein